MPDSDPTRIIVRNMMLFMLRGSTAIRRSVGDGVTPAFVFATLRSANVHHIQYTAPEALQVLPEAGEAGDHFRRGLSVNAIARSFAMPYETVRTCINRLIERGLVVRRGDGVIVPGEVLSRPEFLEADQAIAAAFFEVLSSLDRLGVNVQALGGPTTSTPSSPPPASLIARIATDAVLRASEVMLPQFGDLTNALVYSAAVVLSSERLLTSPQEAWRYAAQDAPPPDTSRDPVSVRALAAFLDLPVETTRRHANDLVGRNLLTPIPDRGVIPHPVAVSDGGIAQANGAIVGHATRVLAAMGKLGFDFGALKAPTELD